MKRIRYKYVYAELENGEQAFVIKDSTYSEEALTHAKEEAYNGEYEIYEVPDPETPDTPTGDDSIWADMAAAIEEGVNGV